MIQCDQHLSRLNRRLYRQGRYYTVKVDVDAFTADGNGIEVFALRDDWAVQKAFQMAYSKHMENTADERKNLGSQNLARWSDFRVKTGQSGTVTDLVPVLANRDGVEVQLTAGEFQLAEVVDSSGTIRTFTWGTPGATDYGLLQEYDKAGNAQAQPSSVTTDAPYVEIDSEVNEATHDYLQDHGNLPPYDQNGVNAGSPFVRIAKLGASAAGTQKLTTGFFTAPCGIVLITGMDAAGVGLLQMTYKAGDYKGVHAPSMLE
jgi:hypothetical protein